MGFDFLGYCGAIEEIMQMWYKHNRQALEQSSNLGYVREHFVKEILANFLPKSVVVGSGEIVDGFGKRSGQQDVIIYRADFPVITSLTPVNTYLIEGVIATIEVKSNLSTGGPPNGLVSALKNAAKVKSLTNHVVEDSLSGTEDDIRKLQKKHTVKTYVIGYDSWKNETTIIDNYIRGVNETGQEPPDLVYQPVGCVVNPTLFPDIYRKDEESGVVEKLTLDPTYRFFCSENPFAIFFQSILRTVMVRTGSLFVEDPEINATMSYSLNGYFSLPDMSLGKGIIFLQQNQEQIIK